MVQQVRALDAKPGGLPECEVWDPHGRRRGLAPASISQPMLKQINVKQAGKKQKDTKISTTIQTPSCVIAKSVSTSPAALLLSFNPPLSPVRQ